MINRQNIARILFALVVFVMTGVSGYAQSSTKSVQKKVKHQADTLVTDIKGQVKTVSSAVKDAVPDSVPSVKSAGRKIFSAKPDSIGVSFENGKWNLPKGQRPAIDVDKPNNVLKPFSDAVKNTSAPNIGGVPDVKKLGDAEQIRQSSQAKQLDQTIKRADSVQKLVEKSEKTLSELQTNGVNVQQVMSLKAVKKLYDSLGVSRLDSIRALIPVKEEVSAEELANALKLSMPSAPAFANKETDPLALAKSSGEFPATEQLPAVPDVSALKLNPESMLELPAIRGLQLPLDSLPMLDSLQKLNLLRQNLSMDEHKISDNVKSTVLKQKPSFWDKTYIEGILSYASDQDVDLIQASPAFGYHFNESISLGVGPSFVLKLKERKIDFSAGYRAFVKYEFLVWRQLGYLHVEDLVDPNALSIENIEGTKHSILAGAGFILPVMRNLGINVCVLYRVNNDNYADGNLSPWVVRIGLSSIKSKKIKSNEY